MSFLKKLLAFTIILIATGFTVSCTYFQSKPAEINYQDAKNLPALKIPAGLAHRVQPPFFPTSTVATPKKLNLTPPGLQD